METKGSDINVAMARQLRAELKASKHDIDSLVDRTKLSKAVLTRIMGKDAAAIRDVSVTQMFLLAEAFNLTLEELVKRAEARMVQMRGMSVGGDELAERREKKQPTTEQIDAYKGPRAAEGDKRLDTDPATDPSS